MSKRIGFLDQGRFMQFIEGLLAIPKWREILCWWPMVGKYPYVIELPENELIPLPDVYEIISPQVGTGNCKPKSLENFWRSARPTARRATPSATPSCWFILIEQDDPSIYDYMLERAPGGIELVEYEVQYESKLHKLRGFFVYGFCGEAIAHAPPVGCSAFECDDLPNGARAAFPLGWTKAWIPEFLWPGSQKALVLYRSIDSLTHQVDVYEQKGDSTPLAGLLREEPGTSHRTETFTLKSVKKVTWKVLLKPTIRAQNDLTLEAGMTTPAVFRIRTSKDEFGPMLLQVLNEAESRQLPEFNYASCKWDTPEGVEQWHFFHSDLVDGALLSSWNSIERFDYVHELAEDHLHVFVGRNSLVTPPFEQVIASARNRAEIVSRIRKLLGDPSRDTIVLLEASEENPGKPILTFIERSQTKLLETVIKDIVKDWSQGPPIRAIAKSSVQPEIGIWRDSAIKNLHSVAQDEQAELERAAKECSDSLDVEAQSVLAQLCANMTPLQEGAELARELNVVLKQGELSFENACSALASVSELVTKPRRAWIREQTLLVADELARLAPMTDEMKLVHRTLTESRKNLTQATTQLINATTALQEMKEPLDDSVSRSSQAVTTAQDRLREIEVRATSAQDAINDNRNKTRQRLQEANIRHEEVKRIRGLLDVEQRNLNQVEANNNEVSAQNDRLKVQLRNRRSVAEAERGRLEVVRDQEIPALRGIALDSENKLNAINQAGINSSLQAVHKQVEQLNTDLRLANSTLEKLKLRKEQRDNLLSELKEKKANVLVLEERCAATNSQIEEVQESLQKIKPIIVSELSPDIKPTKPGFFARLFGGK